MNLQPSISINYNERRLLFAQELMTGGHGQVRITGAGTYTPATDHVFYKVDFFTATTLTSAAFRDTNTDGTNIYQVTAASYNGVVFPAGYVWFAPITSLVVASGTGVIYQYKKFIPEDLLCT